MWFSEISFDDSRSAIVRASFIMRWYERAERSSCFADLFSISFTPFDNWRCFTKSFEVSSPFVFIFSFAFLYLSSADFLARVTYGNMSFVPSCRSRASVSFS